jgi:hypothetical protein
MSRSTGNVTPARLVWPILVVLLSAAIVWAAARILWARGSRKSVSLEMSWKRGDSYYGPNSIHLESACLSNAAPGCFCSLEFNTTTSKEFADYVETFASNRVPVKFHVDYDRNHQVVGAILENVGDLPEERFRFGERSLSTGFRMLPGQRTGGGHSNNPADCFPKYVK